MKPSAQPRHRRNAGPPPERERGVARGFTLVELLVVILIMTIVAAATLPAIAPALDSRRLREASRSITAYIQGARDAAMKTGRPVGVMFERYVDRASGSAAPQISIVLRQVEVPPPYCGDYVTSVAGVQNTAGGFGIVAIADVGWTGAVRIGDMVKLNYQGVMYQITNGSLLSPDPNQYLAAPSATNPWVLTPVSGYVPTYLLAATTPVPLPYQIYRQPVKSGNIALQLPESLVIDLQFSGFNATADFDPALVGNYPVVVTFAPSGTVDRVYWSKSNGGGSFVPWNSLDIYPVHFLLGKRERVNNLPTDLTPDGMANFRDLENYWISIHPQSGLVTVSNVGDATNTSTNYPTPLAASRVFATNAQLTGGR